MNMATSEIENSLSELINLDNDYMYKVENCAKKENDKIAIDAFKKWYSSSCVVFSRYFPDDDKDLRRFCDADISGNGFVKLGHYQDLNSVYSILLDRLGRMNDEINDNSKEKLKTNDESIDVFVSHSSKDKLILQKLVHLIRNAITVEGKSLSIRCTSVPGFGYKVGENIYQKIKEEVVDCRVFIVVLSRNSMISQPTMFECGARWATGKLLIPISIHEKGVRVMKEPLKTLLGEELKNPIGVQQILEQIRDGVGGKLNETSMYYQEMMCLSDYIKRVVKRRKRRKKSHETMGKG